MNKSNNSTTLINVGLKVSEINAMSNDRGFANVTLAVSGSEDTYGNNVSVYKQQTTEERIAEMKRIYTGSGKVIWTDSQDVFKPEFKQK